MQRNENLTMISSVNAGQSFIHEAPECWRDPATHYIDAMRSPWYRDLVMLQDSLTFQTASFWRERSIPNLHLPVTTGSISSPMGLGSDSSPVMVNLAGVDTYLADSMQFMLEYACRFHPGGAWYLMPSFRGEAADSTHLCQFFHSEAEIPGTLEDVQDTVEEYLVHLCRGMLADVSPELMRMGGDISHIERVALEGTSVFRRITFNDAWALLRGDDQFTHIDPEHGFRNLTRAGERELMAQLGEFTWVARWDAQAVPFYQAIDPFGRACNADLLFGPGEVVGAGERHVTGEQVVAALDAHQVEVSEYEWYANMKTLHPLQTAGFGLGVERFFMWLTGNADIRNFQLVPRFNGQDIVP